VRVQFPRLRLTVFWPPLPADPRNRSIPVRSHPAGLYPWSDHFCEALSHETAPDDELVSRYVERSGAAMPDLAQLLASDLAAIEANGDAVTVAVCRFIRDNVRRERLFYMPDAPAGRLIVVLAEQLLTATLPPSELEPALRELSDLVEGFLGDTRRQIPVHPVVAQRLGLEWYRDDIEYGYGMTTWTFRAFTLDRIKWRKRIG
jgi:hypothetical protein